MQDMSRGSGRGLLGARVRTTRAEQARAGAMDGLTDPDRLPQLQGRPVTRVIDERSVQPPDRLVPLTHTRQGAFLRPRFLGTSATFDEVAAVLAAMRVLPLRC